MADGFDHSSGTSDQHGVPPGLESRVDAALTQGASGHRRHGAAYHPAAIADARRHHGRALRAIAAGYLASAAAAGTTTHNAAGELTDARGLVNQAFADLAKISLADTAAGHSSEAGMFLTLCVLIRRAARRGGASPDGTPTGLVDLLSGASHPSVGDAGSGESEARSTALGAYGTLDDRDRVLLWFVAVEGSVPAELAEQLSVRDANAAAILAHRARSRLRRSYATRRIAEPGWPTECADRVQDLVAIVDGEPWLKSATGASQHHESCDRCRGLLAELAALPGPLAAEASIVVAQLASRTAKGRSAAAGAAGFSTTRSGESGSSAASEDGTAPLVISTTPSIGDGSTSAIGAARIGSDVDRPTMRELRGPGSSATAVASARGDDADSGGNEDGDDWDDEWDDDRRRLPLIVAIAAAVVVLAVGMWFAFGRTGSDTVDGDPADTTVTTIIRASTTVGASTSQAASSTSASSSTSSSSPSTSAPQSSTTRASTGSSSQNTGSTPESSSPGQGGTTVPAATATTIPAPPTVAPTVPPTEPPPTSPVTTESPTAPTPTG